jgi:hypothetical protein
MQVRTAVRAKTDDVAGVWRNFRLIQHDMDHAAIIP